MHAICRFVSFTLFSYKVNLILGIIAMKAYCPYACRVDACLVRLLLKYQHHIHSNNKTIMIVKRTLYMKIYYTEKHISISKNTLAYFYYGFTTFTPSVSYQQFRAGSQDLIQYLLYSHSLEYGLYSLQLGILVQCTTSKHINVRRRRFSNISQIVNCKTIYILIMRYQKPINVFQQHIILVW